MTGAAQDYKQTGEAEYTCQCLRTKTKHIIYKGSNSFESSQREVLARRKIRDIGRTVKTEMEVRRQQEKNGEN